MTKLDLTRPIQTRRGNPVEVIEVYNQPILLGGRQIVAMYRTGIGEGHWVVNMWYLEGSLNSEIENDLDLLNTNKLAVAEPIEPQARAIKIGSDLKLQNHAMFRKILSGEAVDLSNAPTEGHLYVVKDFRDDLDYCVLDIEQWIWQIGRRKSDGAILASPKVDIYDNSDYECIWLR